MRAASGATRPRTRPSASMTCQARWISLALGEYVRTRRPLFREVLEGSRGAKERPGTRDNDTGERARQQTGPLRADPGGPGHPSGIGEGDRGLRRVDAERHRLLEVELHRLGVVGQVADREVFAHDQLEVAAPLADDD